MNGGKVIYHFEADDTKLKETTKNMGSTISGIMKGISGTIVGTFTSAFSVATGMITSMTKQAMSSYADLEQNIGGVETLFKQSADKVIKNSQKAYKTAGMSANQYMETVTSFSASLLQSLDNDTEKAVEYSDRAIIDMSDNANKMGTSIEMIQNAYQGFAKQNYTMLDNLKLGYGGTKTEMERLIEDANRVKVANGEMADLSIDSFADITEAIHIIQTEMDITGTTSKEASTTITGSINSMKSAYDNFLNGMGDSGELIDSIVTVVDNVSGALVKLVPNLVDGLKNLLEKLIPKIPPLIKEILPTIMTAILDLTKSIVRELPSVVKTLISGLADVIKSIGEEADTLIPELIDGIIDTIITLLDNVDVMVDAGIRLFTGLAEGLANAIPNIVEKVPEIITKLINALTTNLPKIVAMGPQIMISLISGIISSIPQLVASIPQIIKAIVNGIINGFGSIIDVGKQVIPKLWDGVKSLFGSLFDWAGGIIDTLVNGIKKGASKLLDIGKAILQGIWDGICAAADWFWDKIKDFFGGLWVFVADLLDIGSPSRVFRDEIGQWIPKGVAVGIDANTDSIYKSLEDMDKVIESSFDMQPDVSSMSSFSPQTIVNVQNNMELDPLGQLVNNVKTFSGGAKNDFNWGASV